MDSKHQDVLALEESWANKVQGGVFYSKSDEKFTLRALLENIFADRQFERALDVGPGAGYISEPLANRTKQLTMIEKQPEYAEILRTKFANANIVIGSNELKNLPLDATFNDLSLDEVLKVISITFNIKVNREGDKIILQ